MQNKLKICFLNSGFPPDFGGVATFSWLLSYHMSLSKQISHIYVIAFNNSNPRKEKINKKLSVICFPRFSFWKIGIKILRYFLKFHNYDIFHATNIFPVGFWTIIFGKFIFRKPVFLTFHGTDVLGKSSLKTKFARYIALKFANKAIAVSNSTAKRVAQHYGFSSNKFPVIYFGLSFEKVKKYPYKKLIEKYNLNKGDFVVLTVTKLIKRKGIDDLIKAIHLISEEKIKLVIVGKGPERENLENLVNKLNLNHRVIFAGPVKDVSYYYALSDIFVLPSVFLKEQGDIEGLGIVFLEAQQYGLPVIGTKSGGIPEAIDEGKSGFLVPERDPYAIKEKILLFFHNEKLRRKMGNYARQFVKRKFDWKKCINNYISLYKKAKL